jgi:hypothetical protein
VKEDEALINAVEPFQIGDDPADQLILARAGSHQTLQVFTLVARFSASAKVELLHLLPQK